VRVFTNTLARTNTCTHVLTIASDASRVRVCVCVCVCACVRVCVRVYLIVRESGSERVCWTKRREKERESSKHGFI